MRAGYCGPGIPRLCNNLALAYTMSGDAGKGEELCAGRPRHSTKANAKVRQNLALVLGLQGKYDGSTKVSSVDLAADKAQQNTDLLKKMVKLDAKASGPAALPSHVWDTQVAEMPAAAQAAHEARSDRQYCDRQRPQPARGCRQR